VKSRSRRNGSERAEKIKRYQGYTAWPKLMEALGEIEEA